MPKEKIKPPPEPKVELMRQVFALLEARHTTQADDVYFLLNFFTSADLAGIRDELQK